MNDTFRTFTWDADSNPITIGPVSLTYDALDRMVEQSVSGTNSEIVYNPTGVKLALMNGTTLTKAFVPLTGGATAVYNSSGLAYYRHTDHLGSSRFASTPTQTLYSDTAYSPYGEPYASSGAIDNSFTGQNQDTAAGLYDFLFREQDPNQGRWTSPDPAGLAAVDPSDPQTWNRYVYARNSPLNLTDPTGLDPCQGANFFQFSQAANGTGIFTPEDCALNGGSWDSGCYLDGAEIPCGMLMTIASSPGNPAAACPNNDCSGVVYNSDGLFRASYTPTTYSNTLDCGVFYTTGAPCAGAISVTQGGWTYQYLGSGETTWNTDFYGSGNTGGGPYYNPAIPWSIGRAILSPVTNTVSKVCGQSKPSRAFKSIRNGAIVGAVRGAYTGFVSGEVFGGEVSLGTSGLGGAVVGGFFGGAAGATRGVFTGIVLAETCSALGAYN